MYNDPGYTKASAGPRLFALSLLVLALAVGGALWFDYLGLIDVTGVFAPVLRWAGLQPKASPDQADDPFLLEAARLEKRQEALAILADELDQRSASLDRRWSELEAIAEQLDEKDAALRDREKSVIEALRQVENQRAASVRLSTYLTNMPPADAVSIMVNYPDDLLLSVLLMTDELAAAGGTASLVPYWLSQMPAGRAAIIGERLRMLPELDGVY